jgi:uncharacterized protein (TIGR02147 family)
MIEYLSATQRHFSLRQFSRKAGFASPNYLRLVADGVKNLSQASIARFAQALELDAREHDAFEALVRLGRATSDAERNRYYEQLRQYASRGPGAQTLTQAQFDIYSNWYVLPIRELTLTADFVEDPKWIAKRLTPNITPGEAARALELLEAVGLLARDPSGVLRPIEVKLATPGTVRSLAVRNYHRALLKLGALALDRFPTEERDVTSVTVCLNRTQYEQVRTRIEAFRLELLDLIEDAPRAEDPQEVYSLGFQLIPLTQRKPP